MRITILRSFGLGAGVDATPGDVLDVPRGLALTAIRLGRAVLAHEPESTEPAEQAETPTAPTKKWGRK